MSDSINLLDRATALDTAPAFSPFTGVRIWRDDETCVFAGNETGRVLEADFPWATQEIADSVLASIIGFVYKPFSAQRALLDPAAEMGDGVTVGGVYGVLASVDTNFNAVCASDISAPSDEEIDHEYHYVSPEKRTERRVSKLNSELRVLSDRIISTVEEQNSKISGLEKTVEENKSSIEQRADAITATVEGHTEKINGLEESVEENKASIELTDKAISAEVTARKDADAALESKITQTAESIEAKVTSADGKASEALQTANGFSTRITNAEGNITEITSSIDGISQSVSNAEGMATEALQTANGFSQRVADAEGNISSIEHTLDGVVYTTNDGTTVIDGGHIDTENLKVGNANITSLDVGKLRVGGNPITADNPWDTGYHRNVWVAQASDGSGGNITIDGTDVGYVRLSPTGVELTYGIGSGGSITITATWQEIIESALGGGYATAVFG